MKLVGYSAFLDSLKSIIDIVIFLDFDSSTLRLCMTILFF